MRGANGIVLFAGLAFAAALVPSCTTQARLKGAMLAADAAIACDYGQTLWTSDQDQWDRQYPKGYVVQESNPLLGRTPTHGTLTLATMGAIGANAAVYESTMPTWAKYTWFVALSAVEAYVVTTNAKFAGVCGATGQRAVTPGETR